MNVFRVKAKAPFPYSADGIQSRTVVPGEVFDLPPHLLEGLLAQELVQESDEEVTSPADLLQLQTRAFDPRLAAGVSPPAGGAGFSNTMTEVKDEHREPLRRRAAEDPALAAAAVPQPGNPPPADDRKTPPHPVGTVVDADDLAAREAAVLDAQRGEPLFEPRVAEADEAAEITGKPVQEVVTGTPSEEPAPDTVEAGKAAEADAGGRKAAGAEPDGRKEAGPGVYATKDERPAAKARKGKAE